MFRALSLRTDVLTMTGLSTYDAHPDHVIWRTPSEPTYWMGNTVVFRTANDPAAQVAIFRRAFPTAKHISLIWDIPGLDPIPIRDALGPLGLDVAQLDVLTHSGPIDQRQPPDGIVLRQLRDDKDWVQLIALQCEVGCEEGHPEAVYRTYVKGRVSARRQQIREGRAAWFGAFDQDKLVASMGMFNDTQVARYQDVETQKDYRRRGICSSLLTFASHWAGTRAPKAQQVIVAHANGDAGRLYRRSGFALTEQLVEATKGGDSDDRAKA